MNKIKSTNLIAGSAFFMLVALPIVYVLSMPVAFKLMSDDLDAEYSRPFYAPVYSTLSDSPRLLSTYEMWSQRFGMNAHQIEVLNWQNDADQMIRAGHDPHSLPPYPGTRFFDEIIITDEELKEWAELISKRNDE